MSFFFIKLIFGYIIKKEEEEDCYRWGNDVELFLGSDDGLF